MRNFWRVYPGSEAAPGGTGRRGYGLPLEILAAGTCEDPSVMAPRCGSLQVALVLPALRVAMA